MCNRCTPAVLVVDDDPVFCAIMYEVLTSDGYEVHLAYDVFQALALLECCTPDLILSDIMMPEVDGICLVRTIRSAPAWSQIPTIIISAKAMPEDRVKALEAGANAFVPKPFSIKQFRNEITKYLPAHSS
jgi:CheY-like chemotaxis protein